MQTIAKIITGVFVLWGLICFIVVIYFLARISSSDGGTDIIPPEPLCTISLNKDLTEPQPLVLNLNTNNDRNVFLTPTLGDTVELRENQLFHVACPNGTLMLSGISAMVVAEEVTCASGSFAVRGQNFSFNEITCNRIPYHIARSTGSTCASSGLSVRIEIGFLIHGRFIRIMTACFGRSEQRTFYTEFTLTQAIDGFQSGFPRPNWLEGNGFFNLPGTSIGDVYIRARQRATINKLLGLDESSLEFIRNDNFYLARGHLTAKADFLYGSQQRATFYYVNAAPQWQIFNEGNWNDLEQDIRAYASRNKVDLTIYTGTYGVATLPHATTGEDVELYLFADGENRAVPVPRLFWKIVYIPWSRMGVVFVGVNNPFHFDPNRDVLCTNICSRYEWLSWKALNVTLGFSYCCHVRDFQRVVTNLPHIDINNVLP